jgi:hypothetical protein
MIASCNPYLYDSHEISIRKKSGALTSCQLLSVRDSSLVVVDASDDAKEIPLAHAEVIRFDSIEKISRRPYRLITNETTSRLLEGAIGGGLGYASYAIFTHAHPLSGPFAGFNFEDDLLGTVIGFVSVALITAAIFPNSPFLRLVADKIFSVNDPEDKQFLRRISTYPDDEPELLKLVH